ncbi:unnamed protein product [Euphydryas editha]|uniref:Uncharacterized protein n=1 Tax=Euphydryas editha TaxID=104508 RepID=A0AAU9UFA0_EUPED|nr:unnamed protein product [Euphydryas editha]
MSDKNRYRRLYVLFEARWAGPQAHTPRPKTYICTITNIYPVLESNPRPMVLRRLPRTTTPERSLNIITSYVIRHEETCIFPVFPTRNGAAQWINVESFLHSPNVSDTVFLANKITICKYFFITYL